MAGPWERAGRTRAERIRDSYAAFVEPAVTGLPNWRVVWWFPGVLALGALLLIAFNISGTSAGVYWQTFGEGVDPNLIVGGPRAIRSDEWLVSQSWVISQAYQGFPAVNHTFPGGMDATVLMELPSWDWSTLFRPHEWGYLLFGLDAGIAWAWWVPAIGLVSGVYLLVVTLLPRRAITAALVACAVFFSPMFQWWYGANSLWPAAWSTLAMAATVWMIRDRRAWVRVTWAAVLGWLAVTMAIGIYVPFILPSVLVFVFFFVGAMLQERPWRRGALRALAVRLLPMIVAGVAAIAVVLVWLRTRSGTVDAVQSTVYPGERSVATGGLLAQDPTLTAFFGAPFGQSFATGSAILGWNPSEAATSILLGVFLLPALIWFSVRAWRRDRRVDWVVVASIAGVVFVLAFLLVPGWDPIAKLFLLDKVPVTRYRMGFTVLIPLIFALVAREVDRDPKARNWPLALMSGLFVTAMTATSLVVILLNDPATLEASRLWPVVAVGIIASVVLLFRQRGIPLAALSLLVASLCIGAFVNPFYRGAFDLNETEIGQAVHDVEGAASGTWLGIGSGVVMAVMMQSGVEAYSGVQTYPPEEMWDEIDPDGEYEQAWNRLAHVRWAWGEGEPVTTAPYPDALVSTFDPCSAFAQDHVDYVLGDQQPIMYDCLELLADIEQGESDMQIYAVVPK